MRMDINDTVKLPEQPVDSALTTDTRCALFRDVIAQESSGRSETFQSTYPVPSSCSVVMFDNLPKEIEQTIPSPNEILSHTTRF